MPGVVARCNVGNGGWGKGSRVAWGARDEIDMIGAELKIDRLLRGGTLLNHGHGWEVHIPFVTSIKLIS